MTTAEAREFQAYDHLTAEELVREVEQVAIAIFLWQPPTDGSNPAVSWEALMAKQQAARGALIAAIRAEERANIVKALRKEAQRRPAIDGQAPHWDAAADFVESLDRGEG